MKWLVLFLGLAASGANANITNVIKTADGKTIYCQLPEHVGGVGYKPFGVGIYAEAGGLRLEFSVHGVACNSSGGTYFWQPRSLMNDYSYVAPNGATILVKTLAAEALVINRSAQIALAQTLVNTPAQFVSGVMKWEAVFRPEQLNDLNNGNEVEGRVEYFNRTLWETYNNGVKLTGSQTAGGSFMFTFKAKMVSATGEIHVSPVSIN